MSVACSVRLGHYREHAVSEVALPLIYLGVRCYLFGEALPEAFVVYQDLSGNFLRIFVLNVLRFPRFFLAFLAFARLDSNL